MSYFIKPRKRKYVIRYGFFPFARKLSHKYGNKLLDTGLDTLKTASKKIHIAAEANLLIKLWHLRKKIFFPEKREGILYNLR